MPSHSSRLRRCPGRWTLAAIAAACGAAVVLGCVLASARRPRPKDISRRETPGQVESAT